MFNACWRLFSFTSSWILLVVWGSLVSPVDGFGQQTKGKTSVKLVGKIVSVEQVGKTKNLMLKIKTEEGMEHSLTVLPKTAVELRASGGAEYFHKGFSLSVTVVKINEKLFGKEFSVHVGKAPSSMVKPSALDPTIFDVTGKILEVEKESVKLHLGSRGPQTLILEEGFTVEVVMSDLTKATEGDSVEIEALSFQGGKKLTPQKIVVSLAKAPPLEELIEKEEKPKTPSKTKTKEEKPEEEKTKEPESPPKKDSPNVPSAECTFVSRENC